MNTTTRTVTAVLAAAVMAVVALPAQAQGRHGGYRGGHGGWGAGPALGIGLGIGLGAYYGGYWGPYAPDSPYYYPGYVVVDGTPATTAYVVPAPAQPAARIGAPEPVIYPRGGQSPAQTEADRQECNRRATTQQAAMSDASVFQRAVAACLDGRGYTVR